jgi:hypothetical protein
MFKKVTKREGKKRSAVEGEEDLMIAVKEDVDRC